MKSLFGFIIFLSSVLIVFPQTSEPTPAPIRPRVVAGSSPTPSPTPAPKTVVVTNILPSPTPTPVSTPKPIITTITNPIPVDRPVSPSPTPVMAPSNFKTMSLAQLKAKITEAKRLMQSRPVPTSFTDSFLATDIIRLAFYDWKQSQIDFVVLTKFAFLSLGSDVWVTTSNGKQVRIRTVRSNYVNTAVLIFDASNQPQTPLVVQYPIEKGGSLREMAYYISGHPGVITPEVANAGRLYIRNTIDVAREKLKQKGIIISPKIADIAERLSTVEHVDHQRFWTEYQPQIYNEIFALFALNEGNTYRYSVSSAGAGGMVQMIPSTYYMIRSRYYSVGLIPDFVEGMRNHANAAQAMLLYMQMTWNDLSASETIANALSDGIATQAELMAAGYNSNPSNLPAYVRRGGSNWRALIPRETKIYLQIYASLERAVPMAPRTK